jgi:hypothetical protein
MYIAALDPISGVCRQTIGINLQVWFDRKKKEMNTYTYIGIHQDTASVQALGT